MRNFKKTAILIFLIFALLLTGCTPPSGEQNGGKNNGENDAKGRNMNVCVNIAADGFEGEIIKSTLSTVAEYEKNVKNYVANYLEGTNVGRMFFNVAYRRSVVDSDTVDSMLYNVLRDENGFLIRDENGNTTKTLAPATTSPLLALYRKMLERGIDLFEMAIKETHSYEAEAWFSIRMNDHHYLDDPGFNTSFSYDTPELSGVNGSRQSMDFTKPAVQAYYIEYVRELCGKYDIDGIELDFLRSAPYMASVTEENRKSLDAFVAAVRVAIDEVAEAKGRSIGLAVRVYSEEAENLSYGLDVAEWVAEGSVDQITVSGWYIPTYYNIPVEKWRESINSRNTEGNPYTLLTGTDWAVRCDSRANVGYMMWITLEQLKGFISASYEKGADGIYFFNHFLPENDAGGATYYVDENGKKERALVLKDKLIAANSQIEAEEGVRVYVNTCRDGWNSLYPIQLQYRAYACAINTGTAAENEYIVRVGIDANEGYENALLSVKVNGRALEQVEDVTAENGFVWQEKKAAEPLAQHVSETCARVLQFYLFDLSVLADGENLVEISNLNPSLVQSIKWLEISVD